MSKVLINGRFRFTEKEFNAMLERLQANGRSPTGWFPDLREADDICEHIAEKLEFAIWLLETTPVSSLGEEQRKARKRIQRAITDVISFKEDEV